MTFAQAPVSTAQGEEQGLSAAGFATGDAESWTAQFQESKERVSAVQSLIFQTIPQAMRDAAVRMKDQLVRHRQDPNDASRRALMGATIEELGAIEDATGTIVREGPEVLLTVTDMERRILECASELRKKNEQLDQTLPARETDLAEQRQINNLRKEEFLKDPTNRQLELELLKCYHQEQRLANGISHDRRMRSAQERFAQVFVARARAVQLLHDTMLDTFENLALVQGNCRDTAGLLAVTLKTEDDLARSAPAPTPPRSVGPPKKPGNRLES